MELGNVSALKQAMVGENHQSTEKQSVGVPGGGGVRGYILSGKCKQANYYDETSGHPTRSVPMVAIGESSSSSRDGTMQVPQGEIDKSLPNDDETHGKFGIGTPPPPRQQSISREPLELDIEQGPPPPPQQYLISRQPDIEQGLPTQSQMDRNRRSGCLVEGSDPNDDEMNLGKMFLGMTGQAIVSLMTYTQNGTSSYLAKTKWVSYFVKAAIAVGFIVILIALFLHRKKKLVAADIFQIIGIIATVFAFIVALGASFIPA